MKKYGKECTDLRFNRIVIHPPFEHNSSQILLHFLLTLHRCPQPIDRYLPLTFFQTQQPWDWLEVPSHLGGKSPVLFPIFVLAYPWRASSAPRGLSHKTRGNDELLIQLNSDVKNASSFKWLKGLFPWIPKKKMPGINEPATHHTAQKMGRRPVPE